MSWNVAVSFRRSTVHGRGVFAREWIAAGTRVWQVDPSMPVFDRTRLRDLDARTLHLALLGGYLHQPTQLFLWYMDGMQFINHAPAGLANVGLSHWPDRVEDDHILALRDICPGEELFEDYGMCLAGGLAPDHWMRPLYSAHCPRHYAFLLEISGRVPVEATLAADQGPGKNFCTIAPSSPSITGLGSTAAKPDVRQAA